MASVKALRAQRKADGLCIDCGVEREGGRFCRCFGCRVKEATRYAKRQADLRAFLMFAAGIGLALSPFPLTSSLKNPPNHNI